MPTSQHLQRKLQETLGADAAHDLVSLMESIDPIRTELRELRHEMQLGFTRMDAKFDQLEAKWIGRFDASQTNWNGLFDTHRARTEGLLEKELRRQTQFFFLAWAVLLAAIIGLYTK